jgi:hypothetical protein
MLNLETRNEIIFHFNKKHLEDSSIPMWVIKTRGETYYVDHLEVDKGIGFSSKETPDNPHTKGSLKFKGRLSIDNDNNQVTAKIY